MIMILISEKREIEILKGFWEKNLGTTTSVSGTMRSVSSTTMTVNCTMGSVSSTTRSVNGTMRSVSGTMGSVNDTSARVSGLLSDDYGNRISVKIVIR